MHPLYLSIQGTCPSTCKPTAITFSAADPLVLGGDRIDEDVIHRAIAYALHGRSGWAERQFPDTDWPCMQVTFVFWAPRPRLGGTPYRRTPGERYGPGYL